MVTADERMRILKMISTKQITAAEGAGLLVGAAGRSQRPRRRAATSLARRRWLRVRVTDRLSGRTKVNVNLPIGLVDVGLKMGARFAPRWSAWTSARSRWP